MAIPDNMKPIMKKQFDDTDTNKDGFLDASEFKGKMKALVPDMPDDALNKIFERQAKKAENDNKISFDEFEGF